jgi:Flp pilus assembly pilin Flp
MSSLKNERGQGLTEYAMLLGFVAIAAVVAITLLGNQIQALFCAITDDLAG